MIIAGGGGYGCEIAAILRDLGIDVNGVVDDGQPDSARLTSAGLEFLGPVNSALDHGSVFAVGIGYPEPRMLVATQLIQLGLAPYEAIIHPSAVLLQPTTLGAGSVVMPNATISRGTSAGRFTLINYNASVGHDTALGEGVTVGPNAAIGGECTIGDKVLIGSGATVLQGITISSGATIGSGAVVRTNVEPGQTVVGVPARPV